MNWYKLYKKAQVSGEWWIIGGQAHFADGGVGDLNHNAYVVQHCQNNLLDQFNCGDIESIEWESGKACIAGAIFNELKESSDDEEEIYNWKYEKENDPDLFILNHLEEAGIEHTDLMIADGHATGREDINRYAMKNLGWKRVGGINVTTETLTQNDLHDICEGLYDAYGEEVEESSFNLEVIGSRNVFWSVPWHIIEKKSVSELMDFREKIR